MWFLSPFAINQSFFFRLYKHSSMLRLSVQWKVPMEVQLTVDNKKLLNINNRFPSRFILLIQCHKFATSFMFFLVLLESQQSKKGEIIPNSNFPWSFQDRTVWIPNAETKFTFITQTQIFWSTEIFILMNKKRGNGAWPSNSPTRQRS